MTQNFKILVVTPLTESSMKFLEDAPDVQVEVIAPNLPAVRAAIPHAHAIIARDNLAIDAELIQHARLLKVIGRPAPGLEGIDMHAATERGIIVMNIPGISSVAAAEHTMLLMLALSRKLIDAHNNMRSGFWLMDREQQLGHQLEGKTLGLIGLGRVGRAVAHRALAFGMKVIAFDPYLHEDHLENRRVGLVGLRDLLKHSDYISVHVPATTETMRMFNAEVFKQIKLGAMLINTSHGGVLDEEAAADALKSERLAGLAVDVYAEEPPYNSVLLNMDKVIHTPHIGDNTVEAMQDISSHITKQVLDALRDVDYRNVINLPFIPGMEFETLRPYLILGERIGKLLSALSWSPILRVAVELRGDEVERLIKPITVALLKGMLTPMLGDTVSYINAPMLAAERGIQVTQVKGLHTREYANLVSCQVSLEANDDILIAGTLLDHSEPHIVQINQYRMNFVPEGYMLIMGSYDQPGVIGKIGTQLADNNVNIASWHTGRAEKGGNTLTVLTLDEELPESIMQAVLDQEFVRHVQGVRFD